MGLFDKNRKINKVKGVSEYEYDKIAAPDRQEGLRDRFTREMLINSVWYAGDDVELKQLYERDLPAYRVTRFFNDELNYFWARPQADTNFRKIHVGIPQLISEKMVDLLTSNGYEFNVYDDTGREEENEENKNRLFEILDFNNFELLLPEGIETESWSGGVAIKLSANKKYKYPIIEIIQPEEYEPRVEAGRIVEDIFIKYFNKDNTIYKLKEYYGIDDIGGYIKYKLFRKTTEDNWEDTALTELEQTKDLKDVYFRGIYEKFSIYKPNKLPNSMFRGSRLGESDYSGSHGMFDAIDEIYSTMVQEFRDGKIKNFWPSALLPVDPISQKEYIPDSFKKDFVVYNSGVGEKEKPDKPEIIQGEIHSEKYVEAFKKSLEVVLNNAGLSPQTVGLTGLESVSASEESQELREKTSVRTREKKVSLWEKSLSKLFELVLMLDDIKNGKKPDEYVVDVIFNDYKIQTLKDKTEIASMGRAAMIWDIKSAVEYVHDELTEEQQILMVVRIKIENGINVFTKEEELVYRKYVADIEEPEPVAQETPEITIEEQTEEQIEELT